MLSKSFQSGAYKELLARQAEEDKERQVKLEELRKKRLREDIVRKREEEVARKKEQLARESKEQQAKQAKLDQERLEKQKAQRLEEEEERKRPLSVTEAKERRERAEAKRNASGLAKTRQNLPSAPKAISSRYSTLLASAPTKLETTPPVRSDTPKGLLANVNRKTSSSAASSTRSGLVPMIKSAANTEGVSHVLATSNSKTSSAQASLKSVPTANRPRPAGTTSSSKKVPKNLLAGASDLQPLQKNKRDLRTIEQIQNDLHREKGKDYEYLKRPSSTPITTFSSRTKSATTTNTTPAPAMSKSRSTIDSRPRNAVPTSSKSKVTTTVIAAPSQSRKRTREEDSEDSDDSFISRPSPPARRGRGGDISSSRGLPAGESIWDILNPGKRRDAYLARDIDSDEDDMVANADDIRREEQRAARAAKEEDERELRLLKEKEKRKAAKKKELASRR